MGGYWEEYPKVEAKLNERYLARREAEERANYAAAQKVSGRTWTDLEKEAKTVVCGESLEKLLEVQAAWLGERNNA